MKIHTQYNKKVNLNTSCAHSFSYLSSIEDHVTRHFPGVRSVKAAGHSVLHWQFDRLEVKGLGIDIECFTRTKVEPKQIAIQAIPEKGNAQLSATWKLEETSPERSSLSFDAEFTLEMNIPFWLSKIALPFAQHEISKLFDRYLLNVEKTL